MKRKERKKGAVAVESSEEKKKLSVGDFCQHKLDFLS